MKDGMIDIEIYIYVDIVLICVHIEISVTDRQALVRKRYAKNHYHR